MSGLSTHSQSAKSRSRASFVRQVIVASLSLLLAGACATPVGVNPESRQDLETRMAANAITSREPSIYSDQVLQRFNLRDRFDRDPAAALAELHRTLDLEGATHRLFALAELCYLHAQRAGARHYYWAALAYAYAFLFAGDRSAPPDALDPRSRLAAELYNRALAEGLSPDGVQVAVQPGEHRLPFGLLRIDMPGGPPVWANRPLDGFVPASHFEVRGLRNRYRRAGLGAALMASLGPTAVGTPGSGRLPPRLKVAMTIFLRLDHVREGLATGELRGSLELYSMDNADEITVEGYRVPLEFESSAALAYTLDNAPVWESEIWGFLRGTFLEGGSALYTLTPHRPGRVPVVLIHGTASSPARWADLVNELEADARIAPRVQLWFFTYNTGLPLLYSGGLLRETLKKAVAELDPGQADPALQRMVLIGHSQGGLLAKLAVVNSGTKFWDNVSETPLEDLRVSDQTRAILRNSLFVTPLPFVTRVVFVATPHQGSDVAGFLVQRLRWLIDWALTLPPSLVRVSGEILTASEDLLLRRQLRQGLPRSVDNMSPGNQAIKTLATLPLSPGVTAHSIIAIKGSGSVADHGDGVVSYESAHLDAAVSELIVRSGHSVQSHPEAIEEIRRILLQHLGPAEPTTAR